MSYIIRHRLAHPRKRLRGHRYNVVVTSHALIIIFFMVIPTLIGGYGSLFIPLQVDLGDLVLPRTNVRGVSYTAVRAFSTSSRVTGPNILRPSETRKRLRAGVKGRVAEAIIAQEGFLAEEGGVYKPIPHSIFDYASDGVIKSFFTYHSGRLKHFIALKVGLRPKEEAYYKIIRESYLDSYHQTLDMRAERHPEHGPRYVSTTHPELDG